MRQIKNLITILFFFVLIFSSCRKELIINETGPGQPGLEANSTVANLMKKVSLNDGSNDNIIDNANCFNIQLPVIVIVNGLEIIVDSEEDFDTIEDIFDEFDDDEDELQIIFPIIIVLSDFTEIIINNQSELDNIADDCNGENEFDDDIECIDFVYPITASIFDAVTEQTDYITITNDNEMYDFLEDIDNDDIVNIDFPVSMVLFDGTEISITNLEELETVINDHKDDCDEDDDNDFDDDDFTQQQVVDLLTTCSDWTVNEFELDDEDIEDNYIGYFFNFSNDGTLIVQENSNNFSGTWSCSETGGNIIVAIDIPALPDFNANWILDEIEQDGTENAIDLSLDDDSLRLVSTCN